jgi:CPA1 family monovalent cation:H+ antiporter
VLTQVGFVLAMLVVVVVVNRVSHRTGLPDAALLTVVGLVYAVLPGPNLRLEPEVVLDVVLPPLLYHAALGSSLLAIRSRLRTVVSLSVALVLLTALAVGGTLALLTALPLAAGVALGAAVAPPDPVAALSVGRRAGLPSTLSTLIEGEGLLNDATALTIYQVAVAVAVGGGFSVGLAAGQFLLAAVGGLAFGVAVALLVRLSRRFVSDPLSANAVSLATPFAAYAAAEAVHVSGVLAVVVAGLIVGHQNPRLQTGANRLQTSAVWQLVNFLLEGFVFLLIGQQLPEVIRGLGAYPVHTVVTAAAVTVGVVLLLRPLWLLVTQHVPGRLHSRLGGEDGGGRALNGPEIVALSWAGTRGVITLAAAFALPTDFPARDLLLFSAYLLVLITLLGQGLTFGPLLRRLGLRADVVDAARLRNQARAAAIEAALARLDQIAAEERLPAQSLADVRRGLTARQQRYRRRLAYLDDNPEGPRPEAYQAAARVRRDIIDAQHEELLRWRDAGRLPDASLRVLQRELDHEERTLPGLPS